MKLFFDVGDMRARTDRTRPDTHAFFGRRRLYAYYVLLMRCGTMHSEELPRDSRSGPIAGPPAGAAEPTLPETALVGAGRRLPLWLLTVAAGLVAGAISWAGSEMTFDRFKLADAIVYPPDY